MSSRLLVRTDEVRDTKLTKAKTKQDSLPEDFEVLNAATVIRLEAFQPDFASKMLLRAEALNAQTNSTASLALKREKAKMYISHFFQVFNLGVAREIFPASARTFYHLDVSSNAVPDLNSDDKIHYWGNNIITGDPARVSGGGTAMAMPTTAQVILAINDYFTAYTAHSNLKDAYDAACQAIIDIRQAADDLLLRIWNEVETFYGEGDPANKRKNAREWGVDYINTPEDLSLTGVVLDTNSNPIVGAVVNIEQLSVSANTDSNGQYGIPVVAAGTYTISVNKVGYQVKTIPNIVIHAGEMTNLDIQLISTTGSLRGYVTNNGQPLAGATISIDALGLTVITGSDGMGQIVGIAPGTYLITVSKPNYTSQNLPGILINTGTTTDFSADLVTNTGTLIANVYSQGLPLAGATVRIDSLSVQVITGQDGIGRLEALPPNTYNVTATAPGKVQVVNTVVITANATASLTFDLPPVS